MTAPTKLSAASEAFPGAVVSWAPATSDPVGCIAGYIITPLLNGTTPGIQTALLGHGTTAVVRGLTLGASYTFTVAAQNGQTVGPDSAPTASVTIGTPAAASAIRATRSGKGAVKVAFKAANGNGAAITSYTATCQTFAGKATSSSGKSSPVTVGGLKHGKVYHCVVRASNSRGTGVASAVSGGVRA
jgi:titin